MKRIQGIVEGGVIKLPPDSHVAEGAKVIVSIVEETKPSDALTLPPELEEEDIAFARACRGRLNREMKAESE